eukprot:1158787-Pelagomonas_calceolata.AAC.6
MEYDLTSSTLIQLAGGLMQKRSVDDTGNKGMLVKCNVLGGVASWALDMTWVLGLSNLSFWR